MPAPFASGINGRLQDSALLRRVFAFSNGAKVQNTFAICQDQSGIDGINRGAGHEACGPHWFKMI